MEICSWEQSQGKSSVPLAEIVLIQLSRILVLTIAAELAVCRDDVKGPGTFLPALIDELWTLTPEELLSRARLEVQ